MTLNIKMIKLHISIYLFVTFMPNIQKIIKISPAAYWLSRAAYESESTDLSAVSGT